MLTSTQDRGPLGGGISLSSCLLLSTGQQPLLLLLLGLWPVLVCQLEQLCGCAREDMKDQLWQSKAVTSTFIQRNNIWTLWCISDLGGNVGINDKLANIHIICKTTIKINLSLNTNITLGSLGATQDITCLTVQSLGELVDCRGDFQTFVKDGALPLQANVARPFHKARQITLGLNILACERLRQDKTGLQSPTNWGRHFSY